ncbi:uroporphyrinogen-III synthase [Oscillatoria sp. CS-180]|uniref:uroporphyrinogen-III synthase n=1 Tax=Oscillatoria sp. CS-180 TaxID=3021720 RepID=UPI00232EE949|nr:uroporphyrinogen-III synthase [Oscillatoria sp. CS-180]MDB9526727.1 uroporphyrinogen-III synthase [Oscillatoria sp. CS-180]
MNRSHSLSCSRSILITRSAGQNSEFTRLLEAEGWSVIEMPALEICAPSSWEALDAAIAQLANYDWLILTSANAVHFFLDRLKAIAGDLADLKTLKLAVVGKKTAKVLKQRGLTPNFIPPSFVADSLVADFPGSLAGLKLLFPRVENGGRDILVREMTVAGAEVTEVPAYDTGCPQAPDPTAILALQSHQIDIITFASSKTVRHTCQLLEQGLGSIWADYLKTVAVASIGPRTSETCVELIGRVDIEADEYTLDGLTRAIAQWVSASSD